ncbi:hypothetical protein F2Q69_00010873 [Brassica cretica]|uniref:Glycosyltransferase 2-like domain-containing protein n=1 Tax=Brassica cretica TaxID=69181 RepID=A0A8S9R369_BRACR|nr:hypothetical protein F2Q69_00010873 [Brassica cretica]
MATTPHFLTLPSLLLASVVIFLLSSKTSAIGINYGTQGNLPPPQQVVDFIKTKTIIDSVKIYDANPDILRALSGTGIDVTIMVPNGNIPALANVENARQWVGANVLPFHQQTKIKYICVGNEILLTKDNNLISNLIPAMQSLHEALKVSGLPDMKEESVFSSFFFSDTAFSKFYHQVRCPHISDPAEKYLSLIVPAFNEEQRLPAALQEIMDYLQGRASRDKSFSYEVVIVDDGSVDGTKRVAFDFVRKYTLDNIRLIPLGKNQGKGEAIRKGMMHSRGELLLMLDADGATKVTDLEKLENQILAVAREENSIRDPTSKLVDFRIGDVQVSAFGSRAHLEEKAIATVKFLQTYTYAFTYIHVINVLGFWMYLLLAAGSGIRDTQCGFKMLTRAAARRLFTNIHLKRYCIVKSMMIEAMKWSEIPGSKVSMLSIPNMLWELALMSVGYRTGMWKIHQA